jgi:cytochrome P450
MKVPQALADAIVDPKTYADTARLEAVFAELRREAPLAQACVAGYDPFWVVTRHADVQWVERRADDFLNATGSVMLIDREMVAANMAATGTPNTSRSLVEVDGKEHKELRSVGFASFAPRQVNNREDEVRKIARGFVEELLKKAPSCDFVKEVAYVYPLRVVMTFLGIPPEDEPFMLQMSHQLHGAADADTNRSGEELSGAEAWEGVLAAIGELDVYYKKVTEKFRVAPADCVNSLIANAKIDGKHLTEEQLFGYYLITATAGHDTTAHTIATAMWVLAERPDLLAKLQADPSAIPGFVDETIRWATPVKHFMRTAAADVELHGQTIRKGDWVMLAYHSANRDELVFDAPEEFKIDRRRDQHVAFGFGSHVCLGQHLAKLEMRILWEELLPRIAELRLTDAPKILESNFVCGPKSVPVSFMVA